MLINSVGLPGTMCCQQWFLFSIFHILSSACWAETSALLQITRGLTLVLCLPSWWARNGTGETIHDAETHYDVTEHTPVQVFKEHIQQSLVFKGSKHPSLRTSHFAPWTWRKSSLTVSSSDQGYRRVKVHWMLEAKYLQTCTTSADLRRSQHWGGFHRAGVTDGRGSAMRPESAYERRADWNTWASDIWATLRWWISESALSLWLEYTIYSTSFDKMIIRWLWKQDRAVWFSGGVFCWGICNSSWFRGSHSQRGRGLINFYLFTFKGCYSERHLELVVPTSWFLWHISILFHNFSVIFTNENSLIFF